MTERTIAFGFPGQGSQRVGMLDAFASLPEFRRLLDAAEALSGIELSRTASEGPDSALADTRAAQPLLFLAGLSSARMLQERGVVPLAVAGHSLGELTALAFAEVFSAEAGLELVCARAKIMAEAAREVPGVMAAVLGMESDVVADLVAPIHGVWVANDNAPGQVVLSGTHAGVEAATVALTAAGARKIVPLKVAGPFHSPLMQPARDAFAGLIQAADFSDARFSVIQNTLPEPATDAATIKTRLLGQITAPVSWSGTMDAMVASGIDTLIECGPGSVLTGLTKRVDGLRGLSCDAEGVDRVLEEVGA